MSFLFLFPGITFFVSVAQTDWKSFLFVNRLLASLESTEGRNIYLYTGRRKTSRGTSNLRSRSEPDLQILILIIIRDIYHFVKVMEKQNTCICLR